MNSFIRCLNGHVFDKRLHGNICPYCHMVVGSEALETEHGRNALDELEAKLLYEEIEPVCAWLACIEGPRQGQSFVIHPGKNFIGRADNMDIRLLGDDSVARSNHAVIVYDNRNRQFILLPGDSNGLVYLDNTAIYAPALLTDMCVIQLGRVKLLFKPLCGDNFAWQSYEETDPGEANPY